MLLCLLDYEWESYDGWYNNPAHPEWGGADMPMERKTPVAYPDSVYEMAGQDRPNVLVIANLSQNGLTGFGSKTKTGFFIFFGKAELISLPSLPLHQYCMLYIN